MSSRQAAVDVVPRLARGRIFRHAAAAAAADAHPISLIGPPVGLALPERFQFRIEQIVRMASQNALAVQYVTQYLAIAVREGEFYGKVLELLDEAKAEMFSVARACTGKPKGAACWMVLTSHPGCYFWNGSRASTTRSADPLRPGLSCGFRQT